MYPFQKSGPAAFRPLHRPMIQSGYSYSILIPRRVAGKENPE